MVRRDGLRAGVCVAVIVMAMVATGVAWGAGTQEEVYGTDFEGLTLGALGGHPGDAGQDYWYGVAGTTAISDAIAIGEQSLYELAPITAGTGAQTIGRREVESPDLSARPKVTLRAKFRCATSDPNAMNSYAGSLLVVGGPHPGYLILGFGLNSGNGAVKKEAGVSVSVTAFNGVDNHFAIPLTVGQGLAWDEWHEVELVVHQGEDRYVSLRVDGAEQDLSGYQPPRSYYEGAWLRGQWIDAVHAEIVPVDNFGAETDDEVWWDDVSVTVDCGLALQSDLNGDCRVNVLDLAVMAGEWLMGP